MILLDALAEMPVVAILRGINPDEIIGTAHALYNAGIRIVEVSLNSPEPLESLKLLAEEFGPRLVCGAGTVLKADEVDRVAVAGGQIIVAPNTDLAVIRRALDHGLTPLPGFGTATEAFQAYAAGARLLKLFPASTYGAGHLKALTAVLPEDCMILPVGGVGTSELETWWNAGARGFGIGSDIYRPKQSDDETFRRASAFAEALRSL